MTTSSSQARLQRRCDLYVGLGVNGGFNLTNNDATSHAIGPAFDAVLTAGNSLDKTKAWSVTGGFEHFWSPQWKTSLYGAYGKMTYSDAASAVLRRPWLSW